MSVVERMIGWLAEHGYRVEFKACVVAGHGEVWRAEAEDAEACLTEVLRQMLPSALSREVLNFERPAADPPRPAAAPARPPVVDLRNVPEWDDADDDKSVDREGKGTGSTAGRGIDNENGCDCDCDSGIKPCDTKSSASATGVR